MNTINIQPHWNITYNLATCLMKLENLFYFLKLLKRPRRVYSSVPTSWLEVSEDFSSSSSSAFFDDQRAAQKAGRDIFPRRSILTSRMNWSLLLRRSKEPPTFFLLLSHLIFSSVMCTYHHPFFQV